MPRSGYIREWCMREMSLGGQPICLELCGGDAESCPIIILISAYVPITMSWHVEF